MHLSINYFQTGLADVHVEISFANEYYPCDFAFTYECGMGESADVAAGGSGGGLFFVLNLLGLCGCVVGSAYNYAILQKRGQEIIPGIGEFCSVAMTCAFCCHLQLCVANDFYPVNTEYIRRVKEFAEGLLSRRTGLAATGGGIVSSSEGYQSL